MLRHGAPWDIIKAAGGVREIKDREFAGLSTVTAHALIYAGIVTRRQLACLLDEELLGVPYLGEGRLAEIRQFCAAPTVKWIICPHCQGQGKIRKVVDSDAQR